MVLFADRDTLDAMQLVCSFLLKFIRERELTQLALRSIWRVDIGNGHTPVGRTYVMILKLYNYTDLVSLEISLNEGHFVLLSLFHLNPTSQEV